MPEPGFVTMFHPGLGRYAETPASAVPQHVRAGWVLVTDDTAPAPEPAPKTPTVTRAEAEKTKATRASKEN